MIHIEFDFNLVGILKYTGVFLAGAIFVFIVFWYLLKNWTPYK